ncbi:MAG: hypothetical protein Harvfovirus5_3 [Harvfovirus sp.]|uniref:Uncharacterized protein n=1 Tax=Harvfovirus sp. TaxID=2487768 RepID=A0A3G5A5D0_9VIRU|nr:MAG: hypothetical protein Harvfovirus5_3 [Harvfovirus sp.]
MSEKRRVYIEIVREFNEILRNHVIAQMDIPLNVLLTAPCDVRETKWLMYARVKINDMELKFLIPMKRFVRNRRDLGPEYKVRSGTDCVPLLIPDLYRTIGKIIHAHTFSGHKILLKLRDKLKNNLKYWHIYSVQSTDVMLQHPKLTKQTTLQACLERYIGPEIAKVQLHKNAHEFSGALDKAIKQVKPIIFLELLKTWPKIPTVLVSIIMNFF